MIRPSSSPEHSGPSRDNARCGRGNDRPGERGVRGSAQPCELTPGRSGTIATDDRHAVNGVSGQENERIRLRFGTRKFRERAGAVVAALVLLVGGLASWPAGLARAATSSQPRAAGPVRPAPLRSSATGDLYFVSGEYIERRPVAGGAALRVVKVGDASIAGMAIVSDRLFWVTLTGAHDALSYLELRGSPHVHRLVSNLPDPVGLVAADGWLYWADEVAIGRVRPDGSHVSRRFISLPQEDGGGVADGLATDGRHLFFSRCQNSTVGRVGVNGHDLELSFIHLRARDACPQGLAVGNDHVYWAQLGYVGRATLGGKGANDKWLSIHTSQGPFNVAADDMNVYWDWGGVAGSPTHVGRVRVDRAAFDRSVFIGQGAFLLTSPGANN
jgi:hypothetical protein